jgi:hypothetical protein
MDSTRPDASAARSTDSDARTVPEELTMLSNGRDTTTTPLTVIREARPPPPTLGAGSVVFEPQEERTITDQIAPKRTIVRDISFMASRVWFAEDE